MNMFAKNEAHSVQEYLSMVPENRRKDIHLLHEFIQKAVPDLKPYFASNMIGYGSFAYLDSKKQKRDWPVIALANQKNYISVYVCAIEGEQYAAERYKNELGKVKVGRSCISFKKLEDIDLGTLKTVLQIGQKHPGLIGATLVPD